MSLRPLSFGNQPGAKLWIVENDRVCAADVFHALENAAVREIRLARGQCDVEVAEEWLELLPEGVGYWLAHGVGVSNRLFRAAGAGHRCGHHRMAHHELECRRQSADTMDCAQRFDAFDV